MNKDKVANFNLIPQINKEKLFKRLHIEKETETYKNADFYMDKLGIIIEKYMNLKALYLTVESFNVGIAELDSCRDLVICFVSISDEINNLVDKMMSSGSYLEGYLLNEIAVDVLFNASNELNKKVKEEAFKNNYKLTKRYAPGDGYFELKYQETVLNALKKKVNIEANITEGYMIVPEKSLLYLYGAEKYNDDEFIKQDECKGYNKSHECKECSNINCTYRDVK